MTGSTAIDTNVDDAHAVGLETASNRQDELTDGQMKRRVVAPTGHGQLAVDDLRQIGDLLETQRPYMAVNFDLRCFR
jgi:hypothetical protein